LLITVGSVYIETQEVKSKEILSDLLECIKGVQNPLKGLFLRYYFLMMCKDKLPDVGNQYEGEGGDLNDSINCILNNLTEMNNLWIRLQSNKEKSKREKERVELKITVGDNISRLSKLQGVNKEIY
jgi:vacuolar protein sorting-associated protein 35